VDRTKVENIFMKVVRKGKEELGSWELGMTKGIQGTDEY
jgi:hypothetical protein